MWNWGEEVTGGGTELDNEELHNSLSSQNIIRLKKLRMIRWAGNVARMGDDKCTQNFSRKIMRNDTTGKI
jgi:hypothetical protein